MSGGSGGSMTGGQGMELDARRRPRLNDRMAKISATTATINGKKSSTMTYSALGPMPAESRLPLPCTHAPDLARSCSTSRRKRNKARSAAGLRRHHRSV